MIVAGFTAIRPRPFWYVSLFHEVTVWANVSGGMSFAFHMLTIVSMPGLLAAFWMSGTPCSVATRPPYAHSAVAMLFM